MRDDAQQSARTEQSVDPAQLEQSARSARRTPAAPAASTSGARANGKARHRWSREVSSIEFRVDAFGSSATVMWRKRNEMVIKQGAKMRRDVVLNKDGSVGFSARFAQQIRAEHSAEYEDFTTTADIVLRSVNEVGLFLYFGGTNGWLVLHDDQGRTIHDWTVLE